MLSLFSPLLLVRRVCVKNTESALKIWVINFCSSSENTETKQDQLKPKPHQRGFYRTHTQIRTGCLAASSGRASPPSARTWKYNTFLALLHVFISGDGQSPLPWCGLCLEPSGVPALETSSSPPWGCTVTASVEAENPALNTPTITLNDCLAHSNKLFLSRHLRAKLWTFPMQGDILLLFCDSRSQSPAGSHRDHEWHLAARK